MTAPLYGSRNVSWRYGPMIAQDDVSFALHAGPYRRSASADTSIASEQTALHTIGVNTQVASLDEGRGSLLSWLEPC